ncbi:MAG: hypothetical protein ACLQU4_12820 [Limisphaerales bacterium]
MNVGRLAWRTPTGAMLWEMWGRHKVSFLWQGVALAASACFVYWKEHGASESFGDILGMASFCCFLGAYLHLLVCFAYIETDARRIQLGFPGRLLLKPVGTARLVLVPMVFGGAVIVTTFALWTGLVLPHLSAIKLSSLLWVSTVLLSLFWWMQALAWSLPLLKVRSAILLMVVAIHLVVLLLPGLIVTFAPVWASQTCWVWGIVAALLVSAMLVAWLGLTLVRQGRWEGPCQISLLWSRQHFARRQGRRKKFESAFGAQFCLEWRRQGLVLPGVWGGIALVVFPLLLTGFKWAGIDTPPPGAILLIMLALPLALSWVWGAALAKFDLFEPAGELPVYIAVRPLTNGGFVLAKLVMALASSALTWLLTVTALGLCLELVGARTLFSKAGLATPFGPVAYLSGCGPVLLLLVIWTWKNLVAGMGAGLMGRSWLVKLFPVWKSTSLLGLLALISAAKYYEDFREALLHWLTGVLIVCLAAKTAISIAAFVWGLRRNAITARAVGWIVGGWLVCGCFIAGYADHVCNTIHKPDLWVWAALGGFLILPLADLAIAPLAMAWNRHR